MLYLLTSIAFFLYCIRVIFFWTLLWQRNGYILQGLRGWWGEYPKKEKIISGVSTVLLLIFIFLYGIVIVNEGITVWYQLCVGIFFIIEGIIFIGEIGAKKYIKPIFTPRALVISLVSIFLVAVLYMVPLLDPYVWMVFLALLLPFIIAGCVLLLAFPAEIYVDLLMQKAKKNLEKNKDFLSIVVTGEASLSTKENIYTLLKDSYSVSKTTTNGIADILHALSENITPQTQIFIYEVHMRNKKIMEKISLLLKPDVFVVTPLSPNTHVDKDMLKIIPPHTLILSFMGNESMNAVMKKKNNKIFLYGTQRRYHGKIMHIFSDKGKIKMGKSTLSVKNNTVGEVVSLLPAVFLAKKLGIRNIQKILKSIS